MGGKGSGKGKKVDPNRTDWFTIREVECLGLLKRFKRLKAVATELGVSYRRAERILANIRRKWELSTNTHNRLIGMCKRDEPFRKLLSKPVPRTPEIEEEKEEEEEW